MAELIYGGELPARSLLYHYTSPGTLRLIAESEGLKLSSLARMNDPRESKSWHPTVTGDDAVRVEPDEFMRWQRELDHELRKRAKVACFTLDRQPVGGGFQPYPFNRGFARARMWDQYADRHRGVCLVLDQERLVADANEAFARAGTVYSDRVTYADRPIGDERGMFQFRSSDLRRRGVVATAERYLEDHWRDLLMMKNLDWASEEEYRIILIERLDTQAERLIPIVRSLVTIVAGQECSVKERAFGQGMLEHFGLSGELPARCNWFGGSPQLMPGPDD